MAAFFSGQIVLPIFLLLLCKNEHSSSAAETPASKEVLIESESKDGKLEIVKQIKKINEDGSYTIGYEADDGSFKIESRDVLGNIKGTYGYLDDAGQIKRVSYSTSNASEIYAKPASEVSSTSVVQRIPKINRTISITPRPNLIFPTTSHLSSSTTSSTTPNNNNNVIQRIAKLRNFGTTTTTERPNYRGIVNVNSEPTDKPAHLVYATTTTSTLPKILLQGRPILRTTVTPHVHNQKSEEGQLIRPDFTARPTELPSSGRLEGSKPVVEEPEGRNNNILRRQLDRSHFNPQQHLFTVQQSLGSDTPDVYSGSVTTGPPRPLFTTTNRPRAFLSTTSSPILLSRPTVRYHPSNYQRNLQHLGSNEQQTLKPNNPTSIPIVQIPTATNKPDNRQDSPLVAIRHPFQKGTILVPLSQIQNRFRPENNLPLREPIDDDYGPQNEQYIRETTQQPDVVDQPRPIYVRRLPPPQFRPIPVQVDENGFIRDMQQQQHQQYSLPIPITPPAPRYNEQIDNNIDEISPPVSTRDFQKLLQQLIVRQARLERISVLTDPRRNPPAEYYHQPRRIRPDPYFGQRFPDEDIQGPIRFFSDERENLPQRPRQYVAQRPLYDRLTDQPDQQYTTQDYPPPARRVARLLPSSHTGNQHRQQANEEFLPPNVREMLLLRMLQLAINPALPVDSLDIPNVEAASSTPVPQYKKSPIRNVEILGEDNNEMKKMSRVKRHKVNFET